MTACVSPRLKEGDKGRIIRENTNRKNHRWKKNGRISHPSTWDQITPFFAPVSAPTMSKLTTSLSPYCAIFHKESVSERLKKTREISATFGE